MERPRLTALAGGLALPVPDPQPPRTLATSPRRPRLCRSAG
ncbi:hypothetical protein BN2537_239 [Streptomyces venezuelae]|nr:hypothetical protein BN2537_239 [Streptomyces venezuelae]